MLRRTISGGRESVDLVRDAERPLRPQCNRANGDTVKAATAAQASVCAVIDRAVRPSALRRVRSVADIAKAGRRVDGVGYREQHPIPLAIVRALRNDAPDVVF